MQTYKNLKLTGVTLNTCLEAPSLNKLKKESGQEELQIIIEALLLKAMQNFNVKYQLSDVQIEFFAEAFVEEFGYETIDDLIYCLKSAAKGKFGEIYSAIDPPTLFKWFRLHLDEKYQQKENLLQRKKNANLQQLEASPVNKELNKQFCKTIREELANKNKEEDEQH